MNEEILERQEATRMLLVTKVLIYKSSNNMQLRVPLLTINIIGLSKDLVIRQTVTIQKKISTKLQMLSENIFMT